MKRAKVEKLNAEILEQQSRVMKTPTAEVLMSYFTPREIHVILESLIEVVPYHNKCRKLYDKDAKAGTGDPTMPQYIQEKIAARKKLKKLFTETEYEDCRECYLLDDSWID